ncbi:MAG TPA: transcriptional repressor, partial [Dongiaceae bacterium]|nr:transcriptional repressor [Dongiaceae bacterium]
AAGLLRELVIESGRSYFDTNVTNHHHFFFEGHGALVDIPGENLALASLPTPPEGARVSRVDVVVRVTRGK